MIFDVHVKTGPSFDQKGRLVEDYLAEMEQNGIDRAVLCPNRPASYSFAEGNRYAAEAIERYPGKFTGAFRVDPWNWEASKKDAERYLDSGRFQLLYLNPWEDSFRCNGEIVFPVFEFAAVRKLPVLIETGYPFVSHISQVGAMAEKYPNVNFIATNAGQIDLSGFSLSDVGYMLNLHKNIYVGTGAAVGAEWLANQIQNVSKGRVLFETAYPFFNPYMEKFRIVNAYISEEEKREVFSENLLRLLEKQK